MTDVQSVGSSDNTPVCAAVRAGLSARFPMLPFGVRDISVLSDDAELQILWPGPHNLPPGVDITEGDIVEAVRSLPEAASLKGSIAFVQYAPLSDDSAEGTSAADPSWQTTAESLRDQGGSLDEAAQQYRDAGYSAREAAREISEAYGVTPEEASRARARAVETVRRQAMIYRATEGGPEGLSWRNNRRILRSLGTGIGTGARGGYSGPRMRNQGYRGLSVGGGARRTTYVAAGVPAGAPNARPAVPAQRRQLPPYTAWGGHRWLPWLVAGWTVAYAAVHILWGLR